MKDLFKLLFLQIFTILIYTREIPDKNKVEDLFDGLYDKEIYSGYLKTDVEGHELFYTFTPSQSDPEKDPVLLWLNGGPGCSSLIGFISEVGPVIYSNSEHKFILNEYAWNKNASVIFIESPAGVGFTRIVDNETYYDDTIQAVSLNIALQYFFSAFEEYQANDFYIAGESYAGTYIPHLVKEIVRYKKENPKEIQINLKGILMGNPYVMEETDFEDSMIEFGYSHGLIGYRTFKNYLNECPHLPQKEIFIYQYEEKEDYQFDPVMNTEFLFPVKNVTKKCNAVREEIRNQFNGINFYGILNECPPIENSSEEGTLYKNINYEESLKHSYKYAFLKMVRKQYYLKQYEKYKNLRNLNEEPKLEESLEYAVDFFPSCGSDLSAVDFLNNETIKEKLGADKNITYMQCNPNLYYKWGDSYDFFINDLPELTKNGFKVWLFSGTEDIACATLGTLRWIDYLNLTIVDEWKPWEVDNQVAGMTQRYSNGLKFLTVKNSGHMVPEDRPNIAKVIFDNFISSPN